MKSFIPLVCVAAMAAFFVVETEGSLFPGTYYLIQDLIKRIKKIESRGCETGYFSAEVCDPTGVEDPLCIFSVLLSNQLRMVKMRINFEKPFERKPVVMAAMSGVFSSTDKNCTIETTNITKRGFTMKFTLGGVLPFSLRSSWMACYGKRH